MIEKNNPFAIENLTKTLADIALEKLTEQSKGYYALDFLLPAEGDFTLKAEAGIAVGPWLKLGGFAEYVPSLGAFAAGIRIGGEAKI